jgi:hypothetical protein
MYLPIYSYREVLDVHRKSFLPLKSVGFLFCHIYIADSITSWDFCCGNHGGSSPRHVVRKPRNAAGSFSTAQPALQAQSCELGIFPSAGIPLAAARVAPRRRRRRWWWWWSVVAAQWAD